MPLRPLALSVLLEAEYLGAGTAAALGRLLRLFEGLEAGAGGIGHFAQAAPQVCRADPADPAEPPAALLWAVDDGALLRLATALWTATVHRLAEDPHAWARAFGDLLLLLGLGGAGGQRLFVTQDELAVLLLSVLRPGEGGSAAAVVARAARELSEIGGRRGCAALSRLVEHLVGQGVGSSALAGTVCVLRGLDPRVSFLRCAEEAAAALVADAAARADLLQFTLCDPGLLEERHGAPVDSDLTRLMAARCLRCCRDAEDARTGGSLPAALVEAVVERANMLYLSSLEAFVQALDAGEQGLQDLYLSEAAARPRSDGPQWADLGLDELIVQADWVELPLHGRPGLAGPAS